MGNLIDLTGHTFGRWTVLWRSGLRGKDATWHCVCACSTEKVVTSRLLRSGQSRSCGCLKRDTRIDMTGQVFGERTVIAFAGTNQFGHSTWRCRCSCGAESIVSRPALRRGSHRCRACASLDRQVDLWGRSFGRWTVIGRDHKRGDRVYWLCRCQCGNQRAVSDANLYNGRSASCGCAVADATKSTIIREWFARRKQTPKKPDDCEACAKDTGFTVRLIWHVMHQEAPGKRRDYYRERKRIQRARAAAALERADHGHH